MNRLRILTSLLAVAACIHAGETHADEDDPGASNFKRDTPVEKIEGYGPYKFGMTMADAKKIDPDLRLVAAGHEECEYEDGTIHCGILSSTIFNEKVEVVLQSKDGETLWRVVLGLDRIDAGEGSEFCQKALKVVSKGLFDRYGIPSTSENSRNFSWESPFGGKVHLTQLCLGKDSGMILVTYEPTLGF